MRFDIAYTQNKGTHKYTHIHTKHSDTQIVSHEQYTANYHHSPSSPNHNNLVKKREVEASKQDPGKDNVADLNQLYFDGL